MDARARRLAKFADKPLRAANMTEIPDFSDLLPKIPSYQMPELRMPVIPENPLVTATQSNYASEFHKRLVAWINEFDASLDNAHEVGVRLVSFGQAVVFRLDDLGYWNPSLISFQGHTDDGQPVELIQHVSQISILLMRLPRENRDEPKKPIGFSRAKAE